MKISLFQGILIGVFGLGALIGLFVFATYTGNSTSGESIGKVVVWGTLPESDMKNALVLAAQTEPLLRDVTYTAVSAAVLPQELSAAIATGNAPDLVLASQEELNAIRRFIAPISLETLSPRTFNSSFIQEGQLFSGAEGYYGVPFLVDPLVLFYNRNILASSGIANPPASWESLIGLVPKVASYSSSRQILRGLIGLGTYDNVRNGRAIVATLFLQQGVPLSRAGGSGGLVADLGLSGAGGEPPGKAVVNFYTQFADPAKISYTWNASLPESRQMFLSGDLALYIGYASEARFLEQANPNLSFDAAPIPQPATSRTSVTHGLLYAFMIPRGAANIAGAYQAAALMSGAALQTASAEITGLAPVALSALDASPTDPIAAVAYASALYAKGWLSPAPADVDRVFSGMISNVISGRSNIETAIGAAESSLSALLQP